MISITLDEKAALNSIRLLFGESFHEIKELFESVGIYAILNYVQNNKIVIPYIGELEVSYDGDELTEKGKVAKLKTNFIPSSFLIRNIGQIQDKEITDAEKILMNRFQLVFKERSGSN